jgi:hypothetical protein
VRSDAVHPLPPATVEKVRRSCPIRRRASWRPQRPACARAGAMSSILWRLPPRPARRERRRCSPKPHAAGSTGPPRPGCREAGAPAHQHPSGLRAAQERVPRLPLLRRPGADPSGGHHAPGHPTERRRKARQHAAALLRSHPGDAPDRRPGLPGDAQRPPRQIHHMLLLGHARPQQRQPLPRPLHAVSPRPLPLDQRVRSRRTLSLKPRHCCSAWRAHRR